MLNRTSFRFIVGFVAIILLSITFTIVVSQGESKAAKPGVAHIE